jgi:signal transduction histidine kinase
VLNSNPSQETLPKVASSIDRLVRVLGDLLHGLLDLSRLSTDYYVPEKQRVSLERLVGDICNEYEADAKNKRLRLIRNLQPIRLFDDPVAIDRITRNLLDNALKYTDQGEIRVLTRLND